MVRAMNTLATVDPNAHDRFLLRQRFKLVINQYEFSLPGEDDDPGQPFCFVEQKRFKFKEDIRFYSDDTKTTELFRIKARQRFDPRARYDITAADGTKIGEIQKVFGKSLIRSTYQLFDANGNEVARAQERGMITALFRRLVGFIPYVGDFADWLPIAYHFDFIRGDEKLGEHNRKLWSFRDVYTIDMSGDPQRTIDRRLILANAVGMDALQAR
jgi:uncharacterized protein YxjI